MFKGNQDGNIGGGSIMEFLWVEVGTGVSPCDGISDGKDVGKLEVSGER